ncbi:MAG: glycosyltransferase family 4 protein [Kouleothrix sp.]|nr:glycosyltransferase family 4 protein [Kouleothrix sp.]
MLKIGYDVTPLAGMCTGVGNYTRQLLTHLLALEGEQSFLLLSNRAEAAQGLPRSSRASPLIEPFPSRMLWMQGVLPRLLREAHPDLCHYPNSIGPLASPCPYVVTIHDMTLSVMPQYHPWRRRMLVRPLIPLIARRAARVITVSEQARDDIVRLLRVPAERIAVIREAAAPIYRDVSPEEQARVRERYRLHGPYLLYVGTLEPRKNLVRLIRAWHRLWRRGAIPHRLVLVGGRGWQDRQIYRTIERLRCPDALRLVGYVPTDDLPALYGAADAFAFPSLAEGFGLPVIEAMACGTPTLISTAPALRELVADRSAGGDQLAALAVDPYDDRAIEAALERLLTDAALRHELRERGLRRSAAHSWAAAARQTLEVYRVVSGQ